jgi:lipoprotein-releasing system permease protein
MLSSRIARRYLWAARKHAHTALLSVISMLGLAIGVFALLVSIALLSGLQNQIKLRLMASSPALLIEPATKNTIDDAAAILDATRALGLRNVHPIVTGLAWGANEGERRGRPLRIHSYEGGDEPEADTGMRNTAVALEPGEPKILLTRDAAASLGLTTGDFITIVAPRTMLTPFGPVPVWRRYRIARILPPSTEERSAEGWLELAEAEHLFGTDGQPTSIEAYGPVAQGEAAQPLLAKRFPSVLVKTWKEINHPLFLALRLEKIVMFATISLIIFVAALNLISSLSMIILEKRPQVGVLRTIGATERTILSVFMQLGLFIGLTGTILGNIFGIGLAWLANRYHLIPLPRDIYFISYLPFSLNWSDVVSINIIAVALSVLATWYPARVASRLDPINAIREE